MQRIIISDTADIRQFIQSEVSSKSNEFVSKIYVLLEFAEKKKDKVVFLAKKDSISVVENIFRISSI